MWVNVLVAVLAVIVVLVVMVILAGAIIENAQVREDLDPVPPSPGLRPEESERPALIPHKLDPVTPDRPDPLYFASSADKIAFAIAAARARRKMDAMEWGRKVAEDIEDILGDVREGDTRG